MLFAILVLRRLSISWPIIYFIFIPLYAPTSLAPSICLLLTVFVKIFLRGQIYLLYLCGPDDWYSGISACQYFGHNSSTQKQNRLKIWHNLTCAIYSVPSTSWRTTWIQHSFDTSKYIWFLSIPFYTTRKIKVTWDQNTFLDTTNHYLPSNAWENHENFFARRYKIKVRWYLSMDWSKRR